MSKLHFQIQGCQNTASLRRLKFPTTYHIQEQPLTTNSSLISQTPEGTDLATPTNTLEQVDLDGLHPRPSPRRHTLPHCPLPTSLGLPCPSFPQNQNAWRDLSKGSRFLPPPPPRPTEPKDALQLTNLGTHSHPPHLSGTQKPPMSPPRHREPRTFGFPRFPFTRPGDSPLFPPPSTRKTGGLTSLGVRLEVLGTEAATRPTCAAFRNQPSSPALQTQKARGWCLRAKGRGAYLLDHNSQKPPRRPGGALAVPPGG